MSEQPLSTIAAYTARPTLRIDDREEERVTRLLVGMEMIEQEGGLSSLEARFANVASEQSGDADLAFEDSEILRLGAAIAVYGGEEAAPFEIFRGIITCLDATFSLDGPPELTVLAEDAFQKARMTRRTAVHENVSIADLATQLAGNLSLTPRIDGFDQQHSVLFQFNESDLAFLRRLLNKGNGDLQVVGDALHVSLRSDVRRGVIDLEMGSQLTRFRAIADLAGQATAVSLTGWDANQGERFAVTSRGVSLGPGSGLSGADLLREAIAERSEHIGHVNALTEQQAQGYCDAAFDQQARKFVIVEGSTIGNPRVRVGTHLRISNVGPRFENTYYVVKATHRYDLQSGYVTDFEAECAYLGGNG